MDYQPILENLMSYNNMELAYKEYYELTQAHKSTVAFFEKYQQDTDIIDHIQHPEKIAYLSEDRFINTSRNTSMNKHPRFSPRFFHKHVFFEMIYVLSGEGLQIFEDREIKLTAGDFCIMAPNVNHAIEAYEDCVILNILIRKSTFLDIFINTVRDKTQISMFFLNNLYEKNIIPYLLFHTKNDLKIRNYILDMYVEHQEDDEYSDRIICSILTIFFTQLIRLHQKDLEIPQSQNAASKYETEVFNYIVNNYASVSLEQIASHFHFSIPYCSKLIKKISGQTFSELLEHIRLQQSENFLLYTQLSVAEISTCIGFKNPETFIRMFKRCHNMTPSKFRKINAENPTY